MVSRYADFAARQLEEMARRTGRGDTLLGQLAREMAAGTSFRAAPAPPPMPMPAPAM